MRWIGDEELRRLKEEVDLAALVRASGVELKPIGQDLRGRCPFHQDDGPSLVITPAKNLWHCLGACGVGGTTIDWVMKTQGVSFRHAAEILSSRKPDDPIVVARVKTSRVPRLPAPVALDVDDRELLKSVVAFYHETLKKSPEALQYLERRGFRNGEAVDRFTIGYANRTLGYRLPHKNRKTGWELRSRLTKTGIYRASGHEHFAGCVVFPIFDEGKNVLGIYGRRIAAHMMNHEPKHLYLPGPHKGVWNLEALGGAKEIILCEALIDALTFWCAGFRNVTASYGVHGFTDDHLTAFAKHRVERVLIAYDRDDAGDKAADVLAPKLAEAGFDVARILFPRGADANDVGRGSQNPAEALGTLVRGAVFVAKGRRPTIVSEPSSLAAQSSAASAAATHPDPATPSVAAEAVSFSAADQAREESTEPGVPSTPEPAASAAADAELRVAGDEAQLTLGDRAYRVRGITKNLSFDQLRVNIRVSKGDAYHVDTFDLLSARQRAVYVKQAAIELAAKEETIKRDLGKLLFQLEALQERRIAEATKPKEKSVVLSEEEKDEAFSLLRNPHLLDRIVSDFDRIGVIGEETNKLVGYLAAVSRKMEDPLALLIQSNSAAGKSALMDAVLAFMPEEEVERFTAMTGQSLYYMADGTFKHKILAIAEVAGAEKAGYAIKMLQSEGRISIATTIKDADTGQLKTKKHEVEGPVAIMLTTTEASIDEELQNRAVVLTVNEDREQTRAIHEAQRRRETLEGMLARADKAQVLRVHRNAQRLLKPILVVNPFARQLTFLDTKLRARRDHMKYLTLIRAIALLHQYQRPVKTVEHHGKTLAYIEATLKDVELANRLAGEVLGRSLDELAPQTRRLLMLVDRLVGERATALKIEREDFRFTRREARDYTRWGHSQLAVHLARLVELEYLVVHRGGRGQSFVYELLYDGTGKEGGRFIVGLIDTRRLYDANLPASGANLPAPFRPASGRVPAPSGSHETAPRMAAEPVDCGSGDSGAGTHGTGEAPEKVVVGVPTRSG